MNNKKIKNISAWIIAFVTSLMLFGFLSLGVLKTTLFNQNFMIHAIQKSGYTTSLTKEINDNIIDLGLGSNIPRTVLKDTVPKQTVDTNITSFVQEIYTDIPFEFKGKDQLKNDIQTKVDAYAKDKGYVIDSETQHNIDTLKNTAVDNAERTINISYLLVYAKKVLGYSKTLTLMIIMTGITTLILMIATTVVVSRWKHRKVRMVSYICGGSGLMLIVLPAIILLSRIIDRLSIKTQSIYYFLTTYVKGFVSSFIYWGIGLIILATITWGISEMMRRNLVKGK